ncbi:MAG: helix-turn-helix domain-containing protein [Blastocatellia bacterium]
MARKRSHQHQRSNRTQGAGSERSYFEYLISAPAHRISRTELVRVIRGGEDTYLELKVRFSNVEKLTAEIIALANTDGGAIIFGVDDQLRIEGVDDPESVEEQLRDICARQIQPPVMPWINKVAFDNGRRIVVLELTPLRRPHRTLDDRFYVREGAIKREATREELSRIYGETHLTRFEQVPVLGGEIARDIDESLFWSYIRGVNPGPWGESSRGFPTDQVMLEMGLATNIGEKLVPTVGGMMLFGLGDRISALMPRNDLLLTRYSGSGPDSPIIEQVRLEGNLLHLFEGAWRFIERYLDLRETRPSARALRALSAEQVTPRTEAMPNAGRAGMLNGPGVSEQVVGESGVGKAVDENEAFLPVRSNHHRGAMIEALTNSLIHRDFGARDRQSRINLFDQSVELINPSLQPELPVVSIRYGITGSPNPRIKSVFTNEHYGIPTFQGGIARMLAQATEFARRAPEGPAISYGEFRLRLHGIS